MFSLPGACGVRSFDALKNKFENKFNVNFLSRLKSENDLEHYHDEQNILKRLFRKKFLEISILIGKMNQNQYLTESVGVNLKGISR